MEREIAQWVTMKDRSDDPSHHERTLLPRSYISLLQERKLELQLRNIQRIYFNLGGVFLKWRAPFFSFLFFTVFYFKTRIQSVLHIMLSGAGVGGGGGVPRVLS